jgi:hypothetical protein
MTVKLLLKRNHKTPKQATVIKNTTSRITKKLKRNYEKSKNKLSSVEVLQNTGSMKIFLRGMEYRDMDLYSHWLF